jgi:hypothetical protein
MSRVVGNLPPGETATGRDDRYRQIVVRAENVLALKGKNVRSLEYYSKLSSSIAVRTCLSITMIPAPL